MNTMIDFVKHLNKGNESAIKIIETLQSCNSNLSSNVDMYREENQRLKNNKMFLADKESELSHIKKKHAEDIGDRDMYSKDAMEWKAKASKLNAEKLAYMKIVHKVLTNRSDITNIEQCYKVWLATRNGKGEK